jgi:hypothetical protein
MGHGCPGCSLQQNSKLQAATVVGCSSALRWNVHMISVVTPMAGQSKRNKHRTRVCCKFAAVSCWSVFVLGIFVCSQSGHHHSLQDVKIVMIIKAFAKSGYKPEIKYKSLIILLHICLAKHWKAGIWIWQFMFLFSAHFWQLKTFKITSLF